MKKLIAVLGVLAVAGLAYAASSFDISSGPVKAIVMRAGQKICYNGSSCTQVSAGVYSSSSAQQLIQVGSSTTDGGSLLVALASAFSAVPKCVCASASGGAASCVSDGGAISISGAADGVNVDYICVGAQ